VLQATDGFLFVAQCENGCIIYVSDSVTPVLSFSQVCTNFSSFQISMSFTFRFTFVFLGHIFCVGFRVALHIISGSGQNPAIFSYPANSSPGIWIPDVKLDFSVF